MNQVEEGYSDKSEKEFEQIYQRKMSDLEEKRDAILEEAGKIAADEEVIWDIDREMRQIYKEMAKHCDEEKFLLDLENSEDEFYDCQRKIENELEDKKEMLEKQKKHTYDEEDELRLEIRKQKIK